MSKFRKNIVLKTSDVANYLTQEQIDILAGIEYTIEQEREAVGKGRIKAIVIDNELIQTILQKIKSILTFRIGILSK